MNKTDALIDSQAEEQRQAALKFTNDQLDVVLRRLYDGRPYAEFAQDRRILLQAIAAPAAYLHERGLRLTGRRYAEILAKVIGEIRVHGDRSAIRRVGVYFLHAVQAHMKFQGETYTEESKNLAAGRSVATLLGGVVRRIKPEAATQADAQLTATLAMAKSIAAAPKPKRAPKPATKPAATQEELF